MSYWLVIYRFALGILLVLCLIGVVFMFLPKCYRIRQMQQTKSELEESNRQREADIRELRHNQERFQSDPVFVQRTAREVGMVRPHEVVFRFSNSVDNAGHR